MSLSPAQANPPPERGSYVVARPQPSDSIGGVLRKTFPAPVRASQDFESLLAELDRTGC